jgi:hypothetical protein
MEKRTILNVKSTGTQIKAFIYQLMQTRVALKEYRVIEKDGRDLKPL